VFEKPETVSFISFMLVFISSMLVFNRVSAVFALLISLSRFAAVVSSSVLSVETLVFKGVISFAVSVLFVSIVSSAELTDFFNVESSSLIVVSAVNAAREAKVQAVYQFGQKIDYPIYWENFRHPLAYLKQLLKEYTVDEIRKYRTPNYSEFNLEEIPIPIE